MDYYQLLDWDSGFFGFAVARIIPDKLSFDGLEETLNHMQQVNISLAYWASSPDDAESQEAASSCGGVLVDRKVTYVIDEEGMRTGTLSSESSAVVEEYSELQPNTELVNLAIQAGIYSRFKTDPRIPAERFFELYTLWIQNSVTMKIADAVLVARNEGKVVGMVTVGRKGERADIGLIAVDGAMRGRNLGYSLVRAAQKWALWKGFTAAQVVTQEENVSACRLYEKCGYRNDKIENIYHFWL
ncbi:MAG: GNAT family N-acetyltransferase [Desulfuromonadales bacterium]|nr:GNAT family N-acetyltransferase [Desulfuromonadales bacterium]